MIYRTSYLATHAGGLGNVALASDTAVLPNGPLREMVIGHRPTLDESSDQHNEWPAAKWIRYLEVPLQDWPEAHSPHGDGDRFAIFHLSVRLHPADRVLTNAEWTTVFHRLACAAGITKSNGDGDHRWVAIRTAPDKADFFANLINDADGTWADLPHQLHQRLLGAVGDCEDELRLVRVTRASGRQPADVTVHLDRERGIAITVHTQRTQVMADIEDAGFRVQDDQQYILPAGTPTDEARRIATKLVETLGVGVTVTIDTAIYDDSEHAAEPGPVLPASAALTAQIASARRPAQLAALIREVTDNRLGDLALLRQFAETAAAWAGTRSDPVAGDAEHRLEWIARRLHGIEEDLRNAAQVLTTPRARPRSATPPPPARPAAVPRGHGPVR